MTTPLALVVDDDEPSRLLTATILRAAGFEVIEAVDGVEGLDLARSRRPDLIVSDILMPNMDGFRLLISCRTDEALRGVPFVVLTSSYLEPDDESFARDMGADLYLTRPVEPELLSKTVRDLWEDVDAGRVPVGAPAFNEAALSRYNRRLTAKLEQKVEELARTNEALRESMAELAERAEAERRLAAEVQRERDIQRDVLRNANVVAVVLDREGRILTASQGALRVTGYSEDDLLAMRFHDLVPGGAGMPPHGPLVGSPPAEASGKLITRRGEIRDIEFSVAELREADGSVAGYVGFGIDVTSQRRLEQLKRDFVAMVSHELRTPLTAVIGFTDLLAHSKPDEPLGEHRREVSHLREAGNRMLALVEDLLQVTEVQADGVRLELMPCDLASLAERRIEAAPSSPGHVLRVEATRPVVVEADCNWLGRAVDRLLHNAVKFSPEGGEVVVAVTAEGGEARLSVRDSGVGMQNAQRESIFEAFSQADMSQTRRFGGLGVGLYLVAAVVKAHSGRLEVESEAGVGSTFSIILPRSG